MSRLRTSFWTELTLGLLSTVLFVLTLVWPDWLELTLHVDPAPGNGSVEWAIVAFLAVLAVMSFALARGERSKAHVSASA